MSNLGMRLLNQSVPGMIVAGCLVIAEVDLWGQPGMADLAELNAVAMRDPSMPAQLGARQFELTFTKEPNWWDVSGVIYFWERPEMLSEQRIDELEAGILLQSPARQVIPVPYLFDGPEERNIRFFLSANGVVGEPLRQLTFKDGDSGFYRWVLLVERTDGSVERRMGSIRSFTLPRRLVMAALGDSYASGEGAPSPGARPWVSEYEGIPAHRSLQSGFYKALQETATGLRLQGILAESILLTSSGAILSDLYSSTAQAVRVTGHAKPDEVYTVQPQLDRLAEYLAAGGLTGQAPFAKVDALLISGGGNDFGFAPMLENYLSPLPPYFGFWYSFHGHWVNFGNILTRYAFHLRDYGDRIIREYSLFADALGAMPVGEAKRRPLPGRPNVRFGNVLMAGYPNLFNVPEYTYVSYFWDFHYVLPIAIDTFQLIDINTGVYPVFSSAISIAHAQQNTRASAGAQWHLVPTDHLMTKDNSVAGFNSYFVSRFRATTGMPGPHHETNAYHPNVRGHDQLYRPALRARLEQIFTLPYLEQLAAQEGYVVPQLDRPDLQVSHFRVNFDAATRQLTFRLTLFNRGHADATGVTRIDFREASSGLLITTLDVPALAADTAVELTRTVIAPALPNEAPPLFEHHPGPEFDPNLFAVRDRFLRWYHPAAYQFTAYADNPQDSNLANNGGRSDIVQIRPLLAESARLAVIAQLIHAGLTSVADPEDFVASDLRLDSGPTLAFFGYCDPALAWQPSPMDTFTPVEIELFANLLLTGDQIHAQNLPGYDPACLQPDIRIIRYTSRPRHGSGSNSGNNSGMTVFDGTDADPLIQTFDGGVETLRSSPLDGRSVRASFFLNRTGLTEVSRILNAVTPANIPTVVGPPLGSVLNDNVLGLMVQGLNADVANYELRVGTSPLGGEIYHGRFNTRVEGLKIPGGLPMNTLAPQSGGPLEFLIESVPRDGRTVFVSLLSRDDHWQTQTARFAYPTEAFNARLSQPEDGAFVPADSLHFAWKAASGEVDGYRLLVGSLPGGHDIYGHRNARLGGGDFLPADVFELTLEDLPDDNRILYVTLETLRGDWASGERYQFYPLQPRAGGLAHPEASRWPLIPLLPLPLAVPEAVDRFEARLTTAADGGELLYSSGWMLPQRDGSLLRPLLPAWGQALSTVYLQITTEIADEEETRAYPLLPFRGSSIVAPLPFTHSPILEAEPVFRWQNGPDVVANRLLIGSRESSGDWLDSGWMPTDVTEFPFALWPFSEHRLFYVTLLSRRSLPAGVETEAYSVYYHKAIGYGYDHTADSLDDAWQEFHFGPNNPASAPHMDPDGDEFDNETEALLGLNPLDPDSNVRIQANLIDGELVAELPALLSNVRYQFEWSPTLNPDDWQPLGPVFAPTYNSTDEVLFLPVQTAPAGEPRFYRLRIYPAPRN